MSCTSQSNAFERFIYKYCMLPHTDFDLKLDVFRVSVVWQSYVIEPFDYTKNIHLKQSQNFVTFGGITFNSIIKSH